MADKKSDDVNIIKNQTGISKVFNIINPRKKQDKPEERAVNPMSIRPDNLKVSLNKPNKKIDAIKSLFGF